MAKPTFNIEKEKAGVLLHVQGDLNVQHARETKVIFQQVLNEPGDLHLQLQEVTAFDASAFQLCYLLRLEILRHGRQWKISWPQDAGILDLLEKCGITKIL